MPDEKLFQLNVKLPVRYKARIDLAAHESRMTIREWMQTMLDDVLGWSNVEIGIEPGRTETSAEVQEVAEG